MTRAQRIVRTEGQSGLRKNRHLGVPAAASGPLCVVLPIDGHTTHSACRNTQVPEEIRGKNLNWQLSYVVRVGVAGECGSY